MMFARTALATLVAITTGALLMSKSAEAAPAAAGAVAMLVDDQSVASVLTEPAQYGYGYGYRRRYYRPRYYGGYNYAPRYYGGYGGGYGYAPRYYGGGGYGGYGGY
jgi:hypothetical protein